MLHDQHKIEILKKIAQLCKSKFHPTFSQAHIRRRVQKYGWPNNLLTKSTLSKYLKDPETNCKNVPEIFYTVMQEMLREENIILPLPEKIDRLNANDTYNVLSLFMNINTSDQTQAKMSLPGIYWTYMPSISKPGCIIKAMLNIQEDNGSLIAEELFYYRKEGYSGYVKQVSKGYILEKDGHALMILNDPSSPLPKLYIMRLILGPNKKCLSLSGGGMMVNSDIDAVKIMQRKIVCIRIKENLTLDKKSLIEKHGIGIHSQDTKDSVVKGLFKTMDPHQHGQAISI